MMKWDKVFLNPKFTRDSYQNYTTNFSISTTKKITEPLQKKEQKLWRYNSKGRNSEADNIEKDVQIHY